MPALRQATPRCDDQGDANPRGHPARCAIHLRGQFFASASPRNVLRLGAFHVEVKHPGDRFKKKNQAAAYPVRAKCWIAKTPEKVLPHDKATTALLFSDLKRQEFGPYLKEFDALFTFESIQKRFPIDFP